MTKEVYMWQKGVNKKYTVKGWRIEPPGHPGPALVGGEERMIPPEMILEDEDGNQIGIHPDNPNIVNTEEL